jgi:hypothetical protein
MDQIKGLKFLEQRGHKDFLPEYDVLHPETRVIFTEEPSPSLVNIGRDWELCAMTMYLEDGMFGG